MNGRMTRFVLPIILLIVVFACSEDCAECEKKLEWCMTSEPVSIDLPQPEEQAVPNFESDWEIEVTAENDYFFEYQEYALDSLTATLQSRLENEGESAARIVIAADKEAHFEAVFELMEFARKNDLKAVFQYIRES